MRVRFRTEVRRLGYEGKLRTDLHRPGPTLVVEVPDTETVDWLKSQFTSFEGYPVLIRLGNR